MLFVGGGAGDFDGGTITKLTKGVAVVKREAPLALFDVFILCN